ncbi:hypothetical protein PG995_006889 [Apiospora arundinis]|uniref:Fungal-specific transcription factor domain-containing protein n=1 Tax=Apiospora arundinis TaxID=335852 RepID=A0ABR2JHX8_9PEZI
MDRPSYQTSVFRAQPTEGMQRKIQKRNRPPVSCLLCRTRKVKCDRQQPCERCVKSGEAAFCEYAPRAARKPKGTESRPQADSRPKQDAMSRPLLQVRLQKLEDMVNGILTNAGSQDGSIASVASSSDPRSEVEMRSDFSTPPSTVTTAVTSGTGAPYGHNQPENGYVGATHWSAILESIHDIRGIVEAEPSEEDSSPSPPPHSASSHQAREMDIVYGTHIRLTLDEAVARLPPKHMTDQLVFGYFQSRFHAAPYIHTAKFQREYDVFWQNPSSASLLWLSILASILNVAATVSMGKGEDVSKDCESAHPDKLAALAIDCLIAGDYLAAKPYSIEALLLSNYTEFQRRKDCDSSLWSKFGLLVRLAQRMGYHRDPKYLPSITPFEGEIRRRAWFFIEVFDCLFSFQLGMPPIVREDECDTEAPGNRFDLDFDEHTTVLPPPRPPTEATSTLYLCYKSILCRLQRRVIRFALSIQPPPPYEEVVKLDSEIHAFHEQLPATLRIRPVRSYSFADSCFDIVHRLMVELMYLKTLCVLHRPFLTRDNKDNPRYAMSRSTAIDSALRILDLHAEYDEESRPGGRLYQDRYMFSGQTLHDFLIAAMVLCLDLTEGISTDPAERSRKLKALGTSYKIWSARKHLSPDAAHATRVVGAILRRVSMQEQPTRPPVPAPPQPEVRDGSLASLLNNDTQETPPPPPPMDQSQLIHAMDFSLDFMDTIPLDNVLNDPAQYDWNMIDHYLLVDRPTSR